MSDAAGPPLTSYLVRLAPELTTKSRRTRRRFQIQLVRNLRDALAELGGRHDVKNLWDRLTVDAEHPGAIGTQETVAGHAASRHGLRPAAAGRTDADRLLPARRHGGHRHRRHPERQHVRRGRREGQRAVYPCGTVLDPEQSERRAATLDRHRHECPAADRLEVEAVEFREALPKSENGKINRRQIAESEMGALA